MFNQSYVYLMTNKNNTVIYTGVTSNLEKRVYEHIHKIIDGFTKKYNVNKLVYYEIFDRVEDAIIREKQIKSGSRAKKMSLIKSMNPNFKDLSQELEIAALPSGARNDRQFVSGMTNVVVGGDGRI